MASGITVIVTIRPSTAGNNSAIYSSYINGLLTNREDGKLYPRAVLRPNAFIGQFTGAIDAFRMFVHTTRRK